jgi:hypothetical protein
MMTEPLQHYDSLRDDILTFIKITGDDLELMQRHRDFFVTNAEALVGFILQELSSHPPTRAVFDEGRGDAERLGASVTAWLLEVLEADDQDQLWQRHYRIGIEHIRRRIPNRHMMGLATRIRELLLPMMLDALGQEQGLALFLAFQRFLDAVVALTSTLVDEGQKRCLMRITGFSEVLLDRLQATVFDEIATELGA